MDQRNEDHWGEYKSSYGCYQLSQKGTKELEMRKRNRVPNIFRNDTLDPGKGVTVCGLNDGYFHIWTP